MQIIQIAIGCALGLILAECASGHGTPIHVEVAGSQLVVSQGIPDDGFAPLMFLEDDDDGLPIGTMTLPHVGSVVLWNIPGFEIFGMNEESNLSIEVVPRPVRDSDPLEHRLIWYWNPQSELVESSAVGIHLLGSSNRFSSLPGRETSAEPPPFLLADPMIGQQGFHNHSLLFYGLDNNTGAPQGAYGLFARLGSNQYERSEPFLIVLNYGVAEDQMLAAARAINFSANDLPGDHNGDGQVNAADYVVWRDALSGDIAGYNAWRANFGAQSGTAAASNTPVPEPSAMALITWMLINVTCVTIRRR